jgi:arylsulfatase A-like enzyme
MPADRPNVLLICCDHLRGDWLGCNGHPIVMTPQMDKLAEQGVTFRQTFSECPVCVPARRILMTGMDTYGIGMNTNRDAHPFAEGPKLAEVMTRAGYQTFASGKLHTSPQRNRIGFEDVRLNEEGRRQNISRDDYDAYLADHGWAHVAYTHGLGNNQYGMRLSPLPERFTTTHWTAQMAMEFIERRDPTRPFFLYVSFDKPHPPITPPAEYYELYRDVEFPQPVEGEWVQRKCPPEIRRMRLANGLDRWRNHPLRLQQSLRGFAAMITHIDSMIGVILGQIREAGLLNDTLILLTSDHGDELFDHGNVAKSDFLRGATNVPFIVRPPSCWAEANDFTPGRVDNAAPVSLQDVMPTILETCRVDVPETVGGLSVLPLLRSPEGEFRDYSLGNVGSVYGCSDGRYKYQWFAGDGTELLFDCQNDPDDTRDLAEDPEFADLLATMRGRVVEWMQAHDDPRAAGGTLTPDETPLSEPHARAANTWNNRGRH